MEIFMAQLSKCFTMTRNQSFPQYALDDGNLQSEWHMVIREL